MRLRIFLGAIALMPSFALAAPITSTITFETSDQSMWGSGAGVDLAYSEYYGVSRDSGLQGFSLNSSIGSAYINGSTTGEVGVQVDFVFGTGTVDAVVPFEAGLDVNYSNFVAGQTVTINTVADLQSANSLLQTSFPTMELSADLVFQLAAQISAGGCVDVFFYSGCGGGSESFDTGLQTMELLAINRDGDGEVRLVPALQELAETAADLADTVEEINDDLMEKNEDGTDKTTLQKTKVVVENLLTPELGDVTLGSGPIVSLEVRPPQIETTGGTIGDVLATASVSDQFLDLTVDVDGLLNAAGLVPPLEISADVSALGGLATVDLHALLADITLTPSLSLSQQFTLTPELVMDLTFDHAVMVGKAGGTLTLTNTITGLRAGSDAFDLVWEDTGPLQITPTYRLTAMLNNTTDLGLNLNFNVEALSASASVSVAGYGLGSVGFGPLIDQTFDLTSAIGSPSLNIVDSSFALGGFQSSVAGNVITLDASGAIFTGGATAAGLSATWGTAGNWKDGTVADGGRAVVIDSTNATSAYASSVLVTSGQNITVGNLTIGSGTTLAVSGSMTQVAGANTKFLSNAGDILVGGTLGVAAPISGGGDIVLSGGLLNATSSAGLDLRGQDVTAIGGSTINVNAKLAVGSTSRLGTDGATLGLNISNAQVIQTVNQGTIFADGGTLNWTANSTNPYYVINNIGGRIEATNGGVIQINRNDSVSCGFLCTTNGKIQLAGGTLATDANTASQIRFMDDVLFTNAPHIAGRVSVSGDIEFLSNAGTLTNDGFFSFDSANLRVNANVTLAGTGYATFNGAIQTSHTCGLFGTSSCGLSTLNNGAGHTLQGVGTIGSDVTLNNAGTVSANGLSPLTINSAVNNTGTLSAVVSGGLVVNGALTTTQGRILANGGSVTINGAIAGGDTTGPGGIWTASGSAINLQNGTTQWQSLAADYASLSGGEIVLVGGGTFNVNGQSIEDTLDHIGATGKLTLVDTTFDRATLSQATIDVDGTLQLIDSTIDTGSAFVGCGFLCVQQVLGSVNVRSGGLVTGFGTIDSNITNAGTVRATGGILNVEGAASGQGSFEVANGATLSFNQCSFLGFPCPFVHVVGAEGQVSFSNFKVESDTRASLLRFTGADQTPFIRTLLGSTVTLDGALAQLQMVSQTTFSTTTRTLGQTLETLNQSTLTLAGGNNFSSSNIVSLSNNSRLQLDDVGTSYTGSRVNLQSGSSIVMTGATLNLGLLNVANSAASLSGHGLVNASTITNAGAIKADDGTLEIRNAAITQTGVGRLEATAANHLPGNPDAASILRLSNTTVSGGAVVVGAGALLTGNGDFTGVTATNRGSILVGQVATGNAVTAFHSSTLDNTTGSVVKVSGAQLLLDQTTVTNADGALISVASRNTDTVNSTLTLQNASITGGSVQLHSDPNVTLVAQGAGQPLQRIESAPAVNAVLEGYGTLSNVKLTVGAYSLLNANVLNERLTLNIGTGSITNLGTMQASLGGILELSGGTVAGTGVVRAADGSVVEIRNIVFNGASLRTEGTGVIRDVAQSTFTNLNNGGNFEVGGEATLAGNVNNTGGLIRILDNGVVVLASGGTSAGGGAPDPFMLIGGAMTIDSGGSVDGNGSTFAVRDATVGGTGVIDADAVFSGVSTIAPGGNGTAGLLAITGSLTTSVGTRIVFDVLSTDSFDRLLVGGALALGGEVMFNFLDDAILDLFTQSLSIFDFILGGSPTDPTALSDATLFQNLVFFGQSASRSLSNLMLAGNGTFSATITDGGSGGDPTTVPEPGTLPLMLGALLMLALVHMRRACAARMPRHMA